MLIRFGVANFKSFSSEQVLDLQADERFAEGLDANASLSRNSQILIRIRAIKNAPTAASDSHLPLFLNHLTAKQATR